jgi:hypothetical protein
MKMKMPDNKWEPKVGDECWGGFRNRDTVTRIKEITDVYIFTEDGAQYCKDDCSHPIFPTRRALIEAEIRAHENRISNTEENLIIWRNSLVYLKGELEKEQANAN